MFDLSLIQIFFGTFASLFLLIIPGYIVAQLLAQKFTLFERILVSIPASISIVAIFAIFISILNIKFNIYSYFIFVILTLTGYTLYAYKKKRTLFHNILLFKKIEINKNDFVYQMLVIISVAVVFTVLMVGFSGFIVPPHNDDASTHNLYISRIFEKQTVLINEHFYPYGFHSIVALMMYLIPLPGYKLSLYVIIALTAILPASLYFLIKTVYADKKIAAFSSIASLGFYLFPYAPYGWGGWALLLGMVFVPFVVAISYKSLKENDRGLSVLSGLLVAGTFYVHTTELITSIIFLAVLIPLSVPIKNNIKSVLANIFLIALIAGSLVAYAIVGIFKSIRIIHASENTLGAIVSMPDALYRLKVLLFDLNESYLLFILFLIGVTYGVYKRKYIEFLFIQIIFIYLYIDTSSILFLKPFMSITFPWSQYERLLYIQYYFIAIFSGIGLKVLWSALTKGVNTHIRLVISAVLISLILTIGYYNPIIITKNNIHTVSDLYAPVTQDDINAMYWIKENTPKNIVILNDLGNDGGVWIPSVSNREILMPNGASAFEDFADRLYLLEHIYEVPQNEKAVSLMKRYNIQYIFYGSKVVAGRVHMLSLPMLLSNNYFNLRYNSGSTYIFEFDPNSFQYTTEISFDIGSPYDSFYIKDGFYDRELWGGSGETFRWSSARGHINLMYVGNYSKLELRLKPEVVPTTINLSTNGIPIGTFALFDGYWSNITFNLSKDIKSPLLLEVNVTPTFIPQGESRSLGVALDYIKLKR